MPVALLPAGRCELGRPATCSAVRASAPAACSLLWLAAGHAVRLPRHALVPLLAALLRCPGGSGQQWVGGWMMRVAAGGVVGAGRGGAGHRDLPSWHGMAAAGLAGRPALARVWTLPSCCAPQPNPATVHSHCALSACAACHARILCRQLLPGRHSGSSGKEHRQLLHRVLPVPPPGLRCIPWLLKGSHVVNPLA